MNTFFLFLQIIPELFDNTSNYLEFDGSDHKSIDERYDTIALNSKECFFKAVNSAKEGDFQQGYVFALSSVKAAQEIKSIQTHNNLYISSNFLLGLIQYQLKLYKDSISTFDIVLEVLEQSDQNQWIALFQHAKGNAVVALAEMSDTADYYSVAYRCQQEALLHAATIYNEQLLGSIYLSIASIYFQISMHNEALEYIEFAVKAIDEQSATNLLFAILIVKAENFLSLSLNREAIAVLEAIHNTFEGRLEDSDNIKLSVLMLRYYNQVKNIAKASVIIDSLVLSTDKTVSNLYSMVLDIEKGHYALLTGNQDQGIALLMRVYDSTIASKLLMLANRSVLILSEYYESINNYQESLNWYKEYQKNITFQYQLHNSLRQQFSIISAESNYARVQSPAFIQYKQDSRKHTTSLHMLNVDTNKIAELVSSAANLEDKLADISENASDLSEVKKAINTLIQETRLVHKHRHTVIHAYQERFATFVSLLDTSLSNLSKVEKEISLMTRAGLSSSDISLLLNLSERTVENHRYRIRKKLDIPASTSLLPFFEDAEHSYVSINSHN